MSNVKTEYWYNNYMKYSARIELPVGLQVKVHQCTKIHIDCPKQFAKTMSFLDRKARKYKEHHRRPCYHQLGTYHKIQVDLKNQTLYLVKRTKDKVFNILMGDMIV